MPFVIERQNPQSRQRLMAHISGLSQDKSWDVDIRLHRNKRNLEQNAKFHALVSEIAEHIEGVDSATLKKVIKDLFFYVDIDFNGKQHRIHRETHKATMEEMAELITEVEAWAASEMGIMLREYREYDT